MSNINEWLLAAILGTLMLFEWWAMRSVYRRQLQASLARRQLEGQTAAKLLAQSRQQIKQLQQEVAVLRPLATRAARQVTRPAANIAAANEALSKKLDAAASPRSTLPVDGFADTLPTLQFANTAF